MRGIRKDLGEGTRECPMCFKIKSLEDYYINKNGSSKGLPSSYCKECTSIKRKNRVKKVIPKDGNKFCTMCKKELSLSEFSKDAYRGGKPRPRCKGCEYLLNKEYVNKNRETVNKQVLERYYKNYESERSRRNHINRLRKSRLKSIPTWSDLESIKLIYIKTRNLSSLYNTEFHVDHVVPLRSKYVSGLHTESNLQILDRELNLKKQASSWPDMPIIDKELKQLAKEFYAKTN